jgi:hypothetical protein
MPCLGGVRHLIGTLEDEVNYKSFIAPNKDVHLCGLKIQ